MPTKYLFIVTFPREREAPKPTKPERRRPRRRLNKDGSSARVPSVSEGRASAALRQQQGGPARRSSGGPSEIEMDRVLEEPSNSDKDKNNKNNDDPGGLDGKKNDDNEDVGDDEKDEDDEADDGDAEEDEPPEMIDLLEIVRSGLGRKCAPVVTVDAETDMCQTVFPYTGDPEVILEKLRSMDIGEDFGSVSVVQLDVLKIPKAAVQEQAEVSPIFMESMRSRMLVEKLVESTIQGAEFTFDFLMLLVVASLIAAAGLAADNVVAVVASMLVSPLMGPILAVTVGISIGNREMVVLGLKNEVIALFICVLIGWIVGVPFTPFAKFYDWPNQEMESRGLISGLYTGLCIALPSGIGVALSFASNYSASLVGVAISASLLPPAVNAGLCFAYAMVGDAWLTGSSSGDPVDRRRMVEIGLISFGLTVLNILCIIVTAVGMFKIKQIAPFFRDKHGFYKMLQTGAEYNDSLKGKTAEQLQKELAEQLREEEELREMALAKRVDANEAKNIVLQLQELASRKDGHSISLSDVVSGISQMKSRPHLGDDTFNPVSGAKP